MKFAIPVSMVLLPGIAAFPAQAEWESVMGSSNPSAFKGDDRPVEMVS